MSKVIAKNWWIVREKKEFIIKHLTWKEMEKFKLATSFYWKTEESADNYRRYLIYKRIKNEV
jgi:hypothetical protein